MQSYESAAVLRVAGRFEPPTLAIEYRMSERGARRRTYKMAIDDHLLEGSLEVLFDTLRAGHPIFRALQVNPSQMVRVLGRIRDGYRQRVEEKLAEIARHTSQLEQEEADAILAMAGSSETHGDQQPLEATLPQQPLEATVLSPTRRPRNNSSGSPSKACRAVRAAQESRRDNVVVPQSPELDNVSCLVDISAAPAEPAASLPHWSLLDIANMDDLELGLGLGEEPVTKDSGSLRRSRDSASGRYGRGCVRDLDLDLDADDDQEEEDLPGELDLTHLRRSQSPVLGAKPERAEERRMLLCSLAENSLLLSQALERIRSTPWGDALE